MALALLGASPPARAQQPPPPQPQQLPLRHATYTWDKKLLRASFGFREVVDMDIAKKLSSGLTNVIAMRAYVLMEGENEPVALAVRTCKVVYDLWDEVYRVRVSGLGEERNLAVLSIDGVLRQCTDVKDYPVADRALLVPGKPYILGVIVDVNPISPQMLEQLRRWVSRPAGSTGIGPGDALFGSFVGLFVRQIGTSDRTLKFRTQAVVTPPPP
jgi:hypothetical protein